MNVLTIRTGPRAIHCAWYAPGRREPTWARSEAAELGTRTWREWCTERLEQVHRSLASPGSSGVPDAIGVRVAHAGGALDAVTPASPSVLDALREVAVCAPLHVTPVVEVVHACWEVFRASPLWLVAETAFFEALPLREQLYGLDEPTRRALGVRRFGYHGLFHEAACQRVATRRRRCGHREPARVLSICLEPQPEIAAVCGGRPVMVTGGATPLEGLPGETTSGELDPGVVLALARDLSLGPEQLDLLLCRQSGLRALVGETLSLGEVLQCPSRRTALARDVFAYRVLMACGAGCGALGGLDSLVFSGRYALDGQALVPQLVEALEGALQGRSAALDVHSLTDPLDRLLADATLDAAARAQRKAC